MRFFQLSAPLVVLPCAWLIVAAPRGAAATTSITAPTMAQAQGQPRTLADAPGKDVVLRLCGECHDAADRITKFAKTEDEWADVITDMQSRGLMADDKDIDIVLAYLTRNYGPPRTR